MSSYEGHKNPPVSLDRVPHLAGTSAELQERWVLLLERESRLPAGSGTGTTSGGVGCDTSLEEGDAVRGIS